MTIIVIISLCNHSRKINAKSYPSSTNINFVIIIYFYSFVNLLVLIPDHLQKFRNALKINLCAGPESKILGSLISGESGI